MPVLEPVVAQLIANTEEFKRSMESAKGDMEGLSAEAEMSGKDTGLALSDGASSGIKNLESDLGDAGALGGTALKDGALGGAESLGKDIEESGKEAGGKFSGAMSGGLGKLSDLLNKTGLPLGSLSEGLAKSGEAAKELDGESGSLFHNLAGVGKTATLGLAAAFTGAAVEGLHLAQKMQTVDTSIAVSAGISTKAAKSIGDAFLNTAGQSEFSGQEIGTAYAAVAGQLKSAAGHALSNAQALQVMNASSDLATAKQISLQEATTTVASTMQAFQTPASGAVGITNDLLNAANATGQSISSVGGVLDKMKTKLGGVAPPLGQMSGLLVDMTNHGETGRFAMMSLSTAFTALLKPATAVQTAQINLKAATAALPPNLRSLAAEYSTGSMTMKEATKATNGLSTSQLALWQKFKTTTAAVQTATQAQAALGIQTTGANGKLLPMADIIGQLHNKIAGMNTVQATATLSAMGFGTSASKLVGVIQAGVPAYDKATAAATKVGSAHAAAAEEAKTLAVEFKTVKATVEDLLTKLGEALMPILEKVIGVMMSVAKVVLHNKALLYTLAGVVGGILVTAITAYIASLAVAAVESLANFGKMIASGASWAAENAANIASSIASGIEWMAQHAIMAASYIAENAAMAASATAAFIAENAATLGIIAGVIAVVALVVLIIKHWKQISHFFEKLWGEVVSIFKDAIHWITTHIKELIIILVAVLSGGLSLLPGLIASHWEEISHGVSSAWGAIVSFFKSVPNKIIHALSDLNSKLIGWISKVWKTFSGWIASAWNKEINFWETIPERLINTVIDFDSMLLNWISEVWDSFSSWIASAWNNEINFWEGLPQRLVNAVEDLGSMISSWISGVWSGLSNEVSSGWNRIGTFFASIPSKILSALGNGLNVLASWGSDLVTGIINGITSAASSIGNAIGKVITDGINTAKKAVNSIPVIGSALSAIGLATGGYVTAPTLALVGEAGPEYVIPESLLKAGYSKGVKSLPTISAVAPTISQLQTVSDQNTQIGPVASNLHNIMGENRMIQLESEIQLDGKVLARAMTKHQLKAGRAQNTIFGQYAGGSQTGQATSLNPNAISR